VLDFVTFDGVEYVRWTQEPGRELTRDDLAGEFAVVSCGIAAEPASCPYGDDASAGLMPAGTRMFAVRGYKTEFRLAAVSKEQILLYQAWRSGRAKVGADLYDIAGKIRAIDVRRGEPTPGAPGKAVMITTRADVDALGEMILRAPIRKAGARSVSAPRYWLTFWLTDGTTLGRAYFPGTGDLTGGVALPAEFKTVLDRYLGEQYP
jgi:hypothetical protein